MPPWVRCHLAIAFVAVGLGGCSDRAEPKGLRGPTTVGYVIAGASAVAETTTLSGRVAAVQSSEVRPQVSGLIRRRLFTEGSIVRAGQPLYEIDASLYRAAVNEAEASLASARASADAARVRAERFRPLAQAQAISQQDFTDAQAQARAARAGVQQSEAALDTARITLRFATITAPISGRIGRSAFTEGALVTSNQAEPLARIQRTDPVFVDMQQSGADLIALRRALAAGGTAPAAATVELLLEDGSIYGATGRIAFAESVIDEATGTVTLRARFPNPQGLLLPGMFVRARFAQRIDTAAILVPQAALVRDPAGQASVWVIGPGSKALQRRVEAARTDGANWVVTAGLVPGERIITQGIAGLKPGAPVRPVTADSPQRIAPPGGTAPAASR